MTRRRRWFVFATGAVALAITVTVTVLLGVDVYLHGRYERSAGFNVWGYRGRSVGRKKTGEYRLVMLGGSAAYGYGVSADQAISAELERMLRMRTQSPLFTVVNLGYNNEGAFSFKATLDDYAWLRYDLALFYEGYNDLSYWRPNTQIFRHDSPMFRLSGYMPIFPIIFKEKAAAMVNGGDPGALYRRDQQTTFHASLAAKTGATLLTTTADVAQSLEAQLGRMRAEPPPHVDNGAETGCGRWSAYCRSIEIAIESARHHRAQVMVATQPYLLAGERSQSLHREQQDALRGFLMRRFGTARDVKYVDFGEVVDLENPHLSFDHMHLRAEGNTRVAAAFVPAVLEMAAARKQS
jgi:hypothetical protein